MTISQRLGPFVQRRMNRRLHFSGFAGAGSSACGADECVAETSEPRLGEQFIDDRALARYARRLPSGPSIGPPAGPVAIPLPPPARPDNPPPRSMIFTSPIFSSGRTVSERACGIVRHRSLVRSKSIRADESEFRASLIHFWPSASTS
jgi:hypothetical protein